MAIASNRKAGAAATTGLRLRIGHLEAFAAKRFDEIDRSATHQIKANGIDDQRRAFTLRGDIICLNAVGEAETILKARAAAAFNRQPQHRIFPKLGCNLGHAARGIGGHGDDFSFAHIGYVGHAAVKEKGRRSIPRQPPRLHPLPKVMRFGLSAYSPSAGPPIAVLSTVFAASKIFAPLGSDFIGDRNAVGLIASPAMRTS